MVDVLDELDGKAIVLVAKGCPKCEHYKRVLGKDPKFVFLDPSRDEFARRVAEELGVSALPAVVAVERVGDRKYSLCLLDEEGGGVVNCVEAEVDE